jgi:hypothetical protein
LREAQIVIESWRRHYNEVRPHSSLDCLTPNEIAARAARSAPHRDGATDDSTAATVDSHACVTRRRVSRSSRTVEIGNLNRGKWEHNADRGCSPESTH